MEVNASFYYIKGIKPLFMLLLFQNRAKWLFLDIIFGKEWIKAFVILRLGGIKNSSGWITSVQDTRGCENN